MACDDQRVYTSIAVVAGSNNNNLSVLLQNPRVLPPSEPLDHTLFVPGSLVSGTRSMVSFDGIDRNRSFFSTFDEDDDVDDRFLHRPEKKRRLTVEQARFLEESFEVENKLEPERKVQLAKDLGLQSRQVAVWFQNRRARWKSKQLEKDYDSLQASYNSLKADYDDLLKEKDKLQQQVLELTEKLSMKGKEPKVSKSDMLDSDSLHYSDGVQSSHLDQSDFSQDEEDELSKTLLRVPSYIFPKIEDVDDYSDPPASSCNFGFPVDDHAFWSWAY